jgi:hypothetical protein
MVKMTPLNADAVAFVAAHMRTDDRAEIFATRADDDAGQVAAETMAYARFGCVAWAEDEPVAVVCAIPMWPGVWSVGMYATDRWPDVARATTLWIRHELIPKLEAAGAHRAECRSHAAHAAAHRWLEHLGATYEARLTAFGRNREPFYLYAWTLGD